MKNIDILCLHFCILEIPEGCLVDTFGFLAPLCLEIWKKTFSFNSKYGGDFSLLNNLRILCNETIVAPQSNVLPNIAYARLQNCFLDHWIQHEVYMYSCGIPFV